MNNPPIRFTQSDGSPYPDLVPTKLKDLLEECSHKNREKKYSEVWSVNNKLGFISQKDQFDNREVASKDISNYKIIYKDMYAYNPSRINVGSIARSLTDSIGVVSPMYITFLLKGNLLPIYFDQYLATHTFQENVKQNTSGSVRDSLNFKVLSNFTIPLPCLEEQQKIADYFSKLDAEIHDCDQELKSLTLFKKAQLQQIFSQQLRFTKSDSSPFSEWRTASLSEVAEYKKGGVISKYDLSNDGQECILYGELYTKYTEVITNIYSRTNLDVKVLSKKFDIVIPTSGETADDIALATSCIMKDDVILGGDLMVLTPYHEKLNGIFFTYFIRSNYKIISPLAQGVSVVHLYWNNLQDLQIPLPCLEEQQKIADYLSTLDTQISLLSQKLKQITLAKKAMLQQMFGG